MKWKDIADTVGKIAPALGAALGGPAGGAVGALIAAALGTDNTPAAVAQAIQTNPDAAVKLAEIERDKLLAVLAATTARHSETQQTARAEQQFGDAYVKHTRPKLARQSAIVTFVYAVLTGVLFPVLNAAIEGAKLPGPDAFIIASLFAPCLTYMGARSIDAFSSNGKT